MHNTHRNRAKPCRDVALMLHRLVFRVASDSMVQPARTLLRTCGERFGAVNNGLRNNDLRQQSLVL